VRRIATIITKNRKKLLQSGHSELKQG